MQKHYAPRAGSGDVVRVSGHLDVKVAWFMRGAAHLTGMLVPYSGDNVPVTVTFTSCDDRSFQLDRVFRFAGRKPVRFRSRMEHIGGNELIEFMRFGIGWKLACRWDGNKVILEHRGYVWRLFGVMVPVPLAWVIGRGHAEEAPLSDNHFSMWTHSRHPLFGQVFGYAGSFRIDEVTCAPS
jgi:uncharacterized protein DUF4166